MKKRKENEKKSGVDFQLRKLQFRKKSRIL